ncbi:hypothetical protein Btru_004523 [Bulinus truncatus]|nr:hypothetical protein Btru_004523 [Bulinus truncatus]
METPAKPEGSKRRKLKKILKKKPAILQSSLTSNSYQKKVKAAINVSLNSTRNVRTLQANNRCLANGLERWKRECRMAHDRCNYLLKKNHELLERIMELERFTLVSPNFSKEEIVRQYKHRVEKELFSCAEVFIEKIREVMESCSSGPSEELSLLNLSMPLSLSMTAMQGLDDEDDNYFVEPVVKKSKVQDLSLIAEQSMLHQSLAGLPLEDNLEKITEQSSPLSKAKENILSKLPLRVPVHSKDKNIKETALDLHAESIHLESPEKVLESSYTLKSTKSPAGFTDLRSPEKSHLGKNNSLHIFKENSAPKEVQKKSLSLSSQDHQSLKY